MPFSKLPKKNSPKGLEIVQEFKSALEQGDIAKLERLSQMCGYGRRSSFYKAMDVAYGIKFGGFQMQPESIKEQVPEIIVKPAPSPLRELPWGLFRR